MYNANNCQLSIVIAFGRIMNIVVFIKLKKHYPLLRH